MIYIVLLQLAVLFEFERARGGRNIYVAKGPIEITWYSIITNISDIIKRVSVLTSQKQNQINYTLTNLLYATHARVRHSLRLPDHYDAYPYTIYILYIAISPQVPSKQPTTDYAVGFHCNSV